MTYNVFGGTLNFIQLPPVIFRTSRHQMVNMGIQELSCCWDGRAMLHKANSEKMGVWDERSARPRS